jgi:hypothetical protein
MARVVPPPAPPTPTPFRAERLSGPDGTVEWWGDPLTEAEAIARLTNGEDVVVRGPSWRGNRDEALRLTDLAFGGHEEDPPQGGRMALPHVHPPGRTPEVHVFFDSPPAPYARQRKPPKPRKGMK